jgi:hypothetical protein
MGIRVLLQRVYILALVLSIPLLAICVGFIEVIGP